MKTNTNLSLYNEMCSAIDAAYELDELKGIRDQAKLLEAANHIANNVEAERRTCEIRLRAERKAGRTSAKLERSNPGKRKKDLRTAVVPKSKILADAGISIRQAKQWEKLAAVPEKDFEAALADRTSMPSTNAIIRANAEQKPTPVSSEALWLWGRLRDFERDGLLVKEPKDVMSTMTPEMLDEVHVLAPRVAVWLRRIGEIK